MNTQGDIPQLVVCPFIVEPSGLPQEWDQHLSLALNTDPTLSSMVTLTSEVWAEASEEHFDPALLYDELSQGISWTASRRVTFAVLVHGGEAADGSKIADTLASSACFNRLPVSFVVVDSFAEITVPEVRVRAQRNAAMLRITELVSEQVADPDFAIAVDEVVSGRGAGACKTFSIASLNTTQPLQQEKSPQQEPEAGRSAVGPGGEPVPRRPDEPPAEEPTQQDVDAAHPPELQHADLAMPGEAEDPQTPPNESPDSNPRPSVRAQTKAEGGDGPQAAVSAPVARSITKWGQRLREAFAYDTRLSTQLTNAVERSANEVRLLYLVSIDEALLGGGWSASERSRLIRRIDSAASRLDPPDPHGRSTVLVTPCTLEKSGLLTGRISPAGDMARSAVPRAAAAVIDFEQAFMSLADKIARDEQSLARRGVSVRDVDVVLVCAFDPLRDLGLPQLVKSSTDRLHLAWVFPSVEENTNSIGELRHTYGSVFLAHDDVVNELLTYLADPNRGVSAQRGSEDASLAGTSSSAVIGASSPAAPSPPPATMESPLPKPPPSPSPAPTPGPDEFRSGQRPATDQSWNRNG